MQFFVNDAPVRSCRFIIHHAERKIAAHQAQLKFEFFGKIFISIFHQQNFSLKFKAAVLIETQQGLDRNDAWKMV